MSNTINNEQVMPDQNSKKEIKSVVSGITPSGEGLHIGNYFGAVKPHIDLQDTKERSYYFIADLHALTTVKDRDELEKNIRSVVLDYLALGLDPEKCVFFRQSDVPEHSQLAVILGNYVSFAHMKRMHAFKDKLTKGASQDSINMGLFNYPILMAADILIYKPDGVPVGEDQKQHVELTRDIAESFNRVNGKDIFPLPKVLMEENGARVVGTDGERKMSKSVGNVVEIFGEEEIIRKQIMGAYTDPNRIHADDPGTVEGNTVFEYHDLINDDQDEVKDLKSRYRKGTVGDVEVKQKLFDAHMRYFGDARAKRSSLEKDEQLINDIVNDGAKRAKEVASKTLEEVYKNIGMNAFS